MGIFQNFGININIHQSLVHWLLNKIQNYKYFYLNKIIPKFLDNLEWL